MGDDASHTSTLTVLRRDVPLRPPGLARYPADGDTLSRSLSTFSSIEVVGMFRTCSVVALALVICSSPAFAQRGGGQVQGKIVDETGKGVDQAKVTFIFTKSNDGFFAMTKKTGEYSANDIKAGDWRVQVEAPNFVTARQELKLENKKNTFNLTLKRDNAPELLAKADALFKAGDNAGARAEYIRILQDHPELTGINRAIAFSYGREHNNLEAIKYLDIALTGNPNDAGLLQLATATAIDLSDYPRAMGYLNRIDDATVTDPEVLNGSAIATAIDLSDSPRAMGYLNRIDDAPEISHRAWVVA